jgi:hypothetical protein
MAKSKNHTNHNQSMHIFISYHEQMFISILNLDRKDHRNGIKRPTSQRFPSLSGVSNKQTWIESTEFLIQG